MRLPSCLLPLLPLLLAAMAHADTSTTILAGYKSSATQESAAFSGFSSDRGRQFFNSRHGGDWSCSSCHTVDPRQSGRHAVTDRSISPMAPAINPERFTDAAKVEKWFRRNCKDVLGRACSTTEKGDVITYLQSLR